MAQHPEPRAAKIKGYVDPRTELPQSWTMSPVTRTESVGLINPLAQSGWSPGLGEEEGDEQKQKQKTLTSAEGSLDAGEEAKTQTSLQSCESATERPMGAKRKRSSPTGPLLPLDYEEIRADIVKGNFIPLSIGRLQDVHWFIVGTYNKKTSKVSSVEPLGQTMSEENILRLACNLAEMKVGEIEMSSTGWVNLLVCFTLPVYKSYWPTLCTCRMRETWKNVELYCYLVYAQLWGHYRFHDLMLRLTNREFMDDTKPLTYEEWITAVEAFAKKKASLDIAIPDGCSEKEAQSVVKMRITYLLQTFNQNDLIKNGDAVALFQKRPIPIYRPALDEAPPAIALMEQNLTLTQFHRTGGVPEVGTDKPRAISYQAHLFPLSFISV